MGAPKVAGFEDLVPLTTGAAGSVYRAVDVHIGRVVAIKVLDQFDASTASRRDRFLREARGIGKLSGLPHIVDIYQATFTADGTPCLVTPFMAGGSLADVLATRGPLSADEAITVGATIARALDDAHRRGITHRDIKPESILLDDRGDPALADFGIALVEDATVGTRTAFSLTPAHAPPERLAPPAGILAAESLGDIYSLASTIYTLVAGTPPFGTEADTGAYDFVHRVVETPPPHLGLDGPAAGLNPVLQRALAKNPADRFDSALALAVALESVPHNAAPLAPPDQRRDEPGRSADAHSPWTAPANPSALDPPPSPGDDGRAAAVTEERHHDDHPAAAPAATTVVRRPPLHPAGAEPRPDRQAFTATSSRALVVVGAVLAILLFLGQTWVLVVYLDALDRFPATGLASTDADCTDGSGPCPPFDEIGVGAADPRSQTTAPWPLDDWAVGVDPPRPLEEGASPGSVPLELTEFAFAPGSINVPGGEATIAIRNTGSQTESLELLHTRAPGPTFLGEVPPGTIVEVGLKGQLPGEGLSIRSTVPGHAEAGVAAGIVVVPPS